MKKFSYVLSALGLAAFTVLLIFAQLRNQPSPEVESYALRWSDTTNVATQVDQFSLQADTLARLDTNGQSFFSYVFPYRPYLTSGFNVYDSTGGTVACTTEVKYYAVQKNSSGKMPLWGMRWDVVLTDTIYGEQDGAGELFDILVTDYPGVFDFGLAQITRLGATDTVWVRAQHSGRND